MTATRPLATLAALPYDLLHAIVCHLHTAHSIAALSATCKLLRTFVDTSGWKIFVQTSFPSFHALLAAESATATATPDWSHLARHLTAISTNWTRRGFVARDIDPHVTPAAAPTAPRRRGRGQAGRSHGRHGASVKDRQTLGYHPVLDAYNVPGGGEVLAAGAGADLLLRRREHGREHWWLYEDAHHVAGKDDITALQLLRGLKDDREQHAVVGRANGQLQLQCLPCADLGCGTGTATVRAEFETEGRGVRSVSVLQGALSAVLGNAAVGVWTLPAEMEIGTETVAPTAELEALDDEQHWSSAFLSSNLLAVGKTSKTPLSIYTLLPSGLHAEPVRSYSTEDVYKHSPSPPTISSVYAISPLPPSTGTVPDGGQVFLSGWYHGTTLLQDLRTPATYTARFYDPVDITSAVYSLLPLGRERILVGGARHNILKIFDLRMAGGRVYDTVDPSPRVEPVCAGWATYLAGPERGRDSPVYSLAASGCGERVYAGVEGKVWELQFGETGEGGRERKEPAVPLTMYEFGGKLSRLWKQGGEERLGQPGECGGRLDGRWMEMRNMRRGW